MIFLFILPRDFSITHYVLCFINFFSSNIRILQEVNEENDHININCVDPLGRSALLMAIDNENLDMVELLINYKVKTKLSFQWLDFIFANLI